jgi:hypothetical protein
MLEFNIQQADERNQQWDKVLTAVGDFEGRANCHFGSCWGLSPPDELNGSCFWLGKRRSEEENGHANSSIETCRLKFPKIL